VKKAKIKPETLDRVASVILAGGQGIRLFPLTEQRCKPAVSFGGRYRLIDIPISNSLNSRINRIYVISQYFAANLHQHVLSTYQTDVIRRASFELLCPQETNNKKAWFKGTADAVRQNLDHLLKAPIDYFLILSGDQLYNMNYEEIINFAKQQDADAVIATLPVREAEARRMGLLKIDEHYFIKDFYEKPTDPKVLKDYQAPHSLIEKEHYGHSPNTPYYLGSMGIYVFKRSALISLLKEEGDDFGRHLIPLQVKRGKTFAFLFKNYWEDIGTISSYYNANLALTTNDHCLDVYDENHPIFTFPHHLPSPMIRDTIIRDSLISQGSIIEAKEITHSVVGIRSHIKKGTVIRDSIILGNHFLTPPFHQTLNSSEQLTVGENCLIQKAIIDEHSQIGNNVQLINKANVQHYDGDGIYVRDGIMIVTTGTKLPDHFVF
jgi:glucose-1-phosphate adenylyltransferase